MRTEKLPQNAEGFVPHRPPVLMLRELISCNGEIAEGTASVPDSGPFCAEGTLPRTFLVELLAQLIAAAQGYDAACRETLPVTGYLVGVHEFEFCKDAWGGDLLHLYTRRMNEVEGLLVSEGRITRDNDLLAYGELRCFRAPSFEQSSIAPAIQQTAWSSSGLDDLIGGCMEILSTDPAAGKILAEICFDPNSPVFSGHFPGRPLVPGVIWFEVGFIMAKELFPHQVTLQKIVSARFKKPVGPREVVRLELDICPQSGGFQVRSRLIGAKKLIATFELFLQPA